MRFLFAMLLTSVVGVATASGPLRHKPTGYWSDIDFERLIKNPPKLSTSRLPPGYKIGRCLLVVGSQTRISGKCAYTISDGGAFHIDGPRQIYDGIDYPKAQSMAEQVSADYWADVFKDDDGTWTGYGNGDIRAVHGDRPWEKLRRQGACFVGTGVRVCLWRK